MFDFEKLDKIIHEKSRLAIMALLASRPSWSFQELKAELQMSDGNFGHPYEDPAQTGTCFDDERDPGPTANELRVNGERANSVSGSHQCAGTDREEMETEIKKFAHLLCHTK